MKNNRAWKRIRTKLKSFDSVDYEDALMHKLQVVFDQAQEEQEVNDRALARRLFGDEVKEPLVVNAELGIFPMEDDE